MPTYYIEVTHVDASDDLASDFMTEWLDIEATDERSAFDAVTRQFLAIGRAVTAQVIL